MTENARVNEPKKILLVEDNPGDVRFIEEAFKESQMRYHLSIVGDGLQSNMRRTLIDEAVADVVMRWLR